PHRLHRWRLELRFTLIEYRKGSSLVVHAFKKAHTASRLIVALVYRLSVHKRGYPPNGLSCVIVEYPPRAFTVTKGVIFLRIEYRFNILVERPDPVGFLLVQAHRKVQKVPDLPWRAHLNNSHFDCSSYTIGNGLTIPLAIRFGNTIWNLVPSPCLLATLISPPSFSTAFFTMYKPIPDPSDCSVARKNISKTRVRFSSEMPIPLSAKVISARRLSTWTFTATSGMRLPFMWRYLIAFETRLRKISATRHGSL